MKCLSAAMVLVVLVLPASVQADSQAPAKLIPVAMGQKLPMPPAKKLVVPVAKFYRVDEGVFELEVGKTIDLTDRKIILGVSCNKRQHCYLQINGHSYSKTTPGSRIDLKRNRHLQQFVEDKEVCVLDVVDVALPKGAKGIFTFRLHCP